MSPPLLDLTDIRKSFGAVRAVDGVSLTVNAGETVALVGETGCGKTTLARLAIRLERPDSGRVTFEGRDVTHFGDRRLRPFRRRVQMVFQDPWASLNPRLPVGVSIAEPLAVHGIGERRRRVADLATAVGLDPAHMDRPPHAFSGGQRQRIAIARALALEPALIVADEPVAALDASVQGQILNLLLDLKETRGLAYLLISHDLGVVRQLADRVAVMYAGRLVEEASTLSLFAVPRHPYTRALLAAAPRLGRGKRLPGAAPPGEPPSPANLPPGCPYHPRCPLMVAECRERRPELDGRRHRVACPVVGT